MNRHSLLRISLVLMLIALTLPFAANHKANMTATEDCPSGEACEHCLCECQQALDACHAAGFTLAYCSTSYRACTAECRAYYCDPSARR
jgi:hypothetical protein